MRYVSIKEKANLLKAEEEKRVVSVQNQKDAMKRINIRNQEIYKGLLSEISNQVRNSKDDRSLMPYLSDALKLITNDDAFDVFGDKAYGFFCNVLSLQDYIYKHNKDNKQGYPIASAMGSLIRNEDFIAGLGDNYIKAVSKIIDTQATWLDQASDPVEMEKVATAIYQPFCNRLMRGYLGDNHQANIDKVLGILVKKRNDFQQNTDQYKAMDDCITNFVGNYYIIADVKEKLVDEQKIFDFRNDGPELDLDLLNKFLSNKDKTTGQKYTGKLIDHVKAMADKHPEFSEQLGDIHTINPVDLSARKSDLISIDEQNKILEEKYSSLMEQYKLQEQKLTLQKKETEAQKIEEQILLKEKAKIITRDISAVQKTEEKINELKAIYNKLNG